MTHISVILVHFCIIFFYLIQLLSSSYNCFEIDQVWGWLTISYIFLPGLPFAVMMAYKTISWTIERENISCFSCKFLMLIFQICYFSISLIFPTLIVACTFPVLLIIVKAMLIINNGKELKKLGYIMTLSEGQMESFCQLGLQLYIIMEKPDRHPSNVQLFALSASILMLIKVQVNTYFAKSPSEEFMDDLQRKLFIFPVFLLKNAFILGTSAFVASVSPTAFVINVSIYCAIILLIVFYRTTCTMFGAKKYICSNVFIGIIFFFTLFAS